MVEIIRFIPTKKIKFSEASISREMASVYANYDFTRPDGTRKPEEWWDDLDMNEQVRILRSELTRHTVKRLGVLQALGKMR